MLRRKDRAAVFIRFQRGLERVDPPRDLDDLVLVHPDQRAEHGHGGDGVGASERVDRLRRDLTEAFAGDQRLAAVVFGDLLRDAHHVPAHDQCEHILGAVVLDRLLDLGERHDIELDPAAVARDELRERVHFQLGALARIGRRHKVDRVEHQPALGHHVARDGTVDPAREQQTRLARRADRQTAGALSLVAVDEYLIADLHGHGQLRFVDVHLERMDIGKNMRADFRGDLGRRHRELFVASLAVDLEGADVSQVVAEKFERRALDIVDVLFADRRDGKADDPEHAGDPFNGFVEVDVVAVRLRHDRGLRFAERERPEGRKSAPHIFDQYIFKRRAVESLEDDLAVFDQNDFFHTVILFCEWCRAPPGSRRGRPAAPLRSSLSKG